MSFLTAGFTLAEFFDQSEKSIPFKGQKDIQFYIGEIQSDIQEKDTYNRCEIKVTAILADEIWENTACGGFLYYKNGKNKADLFYGQKLLIKGQPEVIPPPKNPNEFNYKQYLGWRNLYVRDFADREEIRIVYTSQNIYKKLLEFKNTLRGIIVSHLPSESAQSILLAMLLGDREDINQDIRRAYASAGASHILAVSGLHVGILYVILHFALGFLKRRQSLRWLFYVLSLTILWGYAAMTGFSPSVSRASLMFSFFLVADFARINGNAFNTLAASALILLIIDPFILFSLSFQLSYLAVLGILLFYPGMYAWISTKNRFLDYFWKLICVSTAAQLFIFPLLMHTFHQFPVVFPLTNLIVVPAAAMIVTGGIFVLLSSVIPWISEKIGHLLSAFIDGVNGIISHIEAIPFSSINDIYISPLQLVVLYILVTALMLFQSYKKWAFYYTALAAALVILTTSISLAYRSLHRSETVIYSVPGAVCIDFIKGRKAITFQQPLLHQRQRDFLVNPYRLRARIDEVAPLDNMLVHRPGESDAFHLLVFRGKTFAIINECHAPGITTIMDGADYVIYNCHMNRARDHVLHKPHALHIFRDAREICLDTGGKTGQDDRERARMHCLDQGALIINIP